MIAFFFPFFLTCIASIILTGMLRHYVRAKNILDIPNNRSSHRIPTPRGGGIIIFLLFTLLSAALALEKMIPLFLFLALSGGIAIAIVGWMDDVASVSPILRFMVHAFASAWALYWLHPMGSIGFYLLIFIGIIWSINLYNFMDGIDGLAGMEGLFISLAAAFALAWFNAMGVALLCFLLAAAISGFLVWNWQPAKIFMGDVGSGYLGFIFAVLAIATADARVLSLPFWLAIAGVFVCDATFTVMSRMYQGKRWYEAHLEHAYQRLVHRGLSHKAVTNYILLINVFILLPIAYCMLLFLSKNIWVGVALVLVAFLVWSAITRSFFFKKELT